MSLLITVEEPFRCGIKIKRCLRRDKPKCPYFSPWNEMRKRWRDYFAMGHTFFSFNEISSYLVASSQNLLRRTTQEENCQTNPCKTQLSIKLVTHVLLCIYKLFLGLNGWGHLLVLFHLQSIMCLVFCFVLLVYWVGWFLIVVCSFLVLSNLCQFSRLWHSVYFKHAKKQLTNFSVENWQNIFALTSLFWWFSLLIIVTGCG